MENEEMRAMFAAHAMRELLRTNGLAVKKAYESAGDDDFDPYVPLREMCEAAWTVANCMMKARGNEDGL